MVSKYDLLYSVFLNEGLSAAQLVRKLGKTQYEYNTVYKHLKQLEEDGLTEAKRNKYFLKKNEKAKKFVKVIDFCVRNRIDYNELFLEKTIEFIELGLKKLVLEDLPFDNKTVSRISSFLSKHGFLLIESRKPFTARIVSSVFLEKVVELFKEKVKVGCGKVFENVNGEKLNSRLEKEFSTFKKSSKQISLDDEVRFIHRSLSLEGNTLTLSETERLIKENIPSKTATFREMQETADYKKALDKLIADRTTLNLEKVLDFHGVAMNSLEAGAGQIRKQNVRIKGNPEFKTADWKEVPTKLNSLFRFYAENIFEKMKAFEIIGMASYLHSEFQKIHPFIDGNSRTARAIFVHTLIIKSFPLITFPAGFIEQYMGLTKLSKKRNDKHFELLMKQIVLHSLKQTNQKLKYT